MDVMESAWGDRICTKGRQLLFRRRGLMELFQNVCWSKNLAKKIFSGERALNN
jgi:hypothetical protein